jgi:hypothetical protein
LGASTGGSSSGSNSDNPGEVLGAATGPGFPTTGLGPQASGGNLLGSLMIFSSLILYSFYKAAKNA